AGVGELLLRVRWEADGAPAAGVHAWLRKRLLPHPLLLCTDANGEARAASVEPGRATVILDRGGSADVDIRGGERSGCGIAIRIGRRVEVDVVDESEKPVAGAYIWLGWGGGEGTEIGTTDAAGHMSIRDVGQRCIAARAPGRCPSGNAAMPIEGKPGETVS